MNEIVDAEIIGSLSNFGEVKFAKISKDVIYPEFKRILLKIVYGILGVAAMNYFINMAIVWPLYYWERPFLIENLFSPMLFFVFFFMIFSIIFFGSQVWSYLLFKHGIAPQLSNGERIRNVIKRLGIKGFKIALIIQFIVGFFEPAVGILVSCVTITFGSNIYVTMEATRLGIPKAVNVLMDMIDKYKTGNA